MTLEELKQSKDYQSVIDMYNNYLEDDKILKSVIEKNVDLSSFYTNYNNIFPKLFVVAAANLFEKIVCDFIKNCFSESNDMVYNFISNQALERKYHSMFDWKSPNANKFYSLFGLNFKIHMTNLIKTESNLEACQKAFMNLGHSRNEIVHLGISAFNLGKTTSEVYNEFEKSLYFVLCVFDQLKIKYRSEILE